MVTGFDIRREIERVKTNPQKYTAEERPAFAEVIWALAQIGARVSIHSHPNTLIDARLIKDPDEWKQIIFYLEQVTRLTIPEEDYLLVGHPPMMAENSHPVTIGDVVNYIVARRTADPE